MNVIDFLKDHIVYLDGGMGTLLQAEGLQPGELPEMWNLTHPEIVTKLLKAYYDAGSHIVNANTFGANSLKFSAEELEAIIKAALDNVRAARDASVSPQEKWIALDIGPTGRMLAPYGDLDFEDAVAIFAETVRLGVKYGADLIFIETMNDSYETKAALLAAKENSDLPVFVSNAYGSDGKLMTGATPAAMTAMLEGMGADAIGVNCSLGPKALAAVVEEYLACASVPVLLKPNAGLPRAINGKTVYDVPADEFAEDVVALIEKGVRVAGGCCGTTPEYIAALVSASKDCTPVTIEPKAISCVSSYTHAVSFGARPLLIGERINPTGKKRFKEALKARDISYILKEGIAQQEKGAHILDVNVGLPGIDEVDMLKTAVCERQAVVDLPLLIDTTHPAAMEAALRRYNGKALINSVSGKQEVMDTVFPLAKKYGGMIVALTLDDDGIPATAEERLHVAEKILAEAAKYGIDKKELLFDPLTMTVSADPSAALETLRAVSLIKNKLGCRTSLGVSNVSFGLPQRDALNSSFFLLAMGQGLDAAIMNPYSVDMLKAWHTFNALNGLDTNFAGYIAFAETAAQAAPVAAPVKKTDATAPAQSAAQAQSELQNAVIKGLKDRAAQLTRELMATSDPMQLVQEDIIPALNIVGTGFEKKTVYLPQLLMSAEAAKASFEQIKAVLSADRAADKCAFVIATVKGDIHDIGKNIVRLLLENYGFAVTDLGRDVAPEVIVDTVLKLNAPLVGLSALMTTTVPAMEETIRLLREKAPHCRVVVGGAVLNQEYADAIGADKYARDAMETVRYAEEINAQLTK